MSNETKWTPGPWVVGESSHNGLPCVDACDPNDGQLMIEICEVWGEDRAESETEMSRANAHLISAAPELYEALASMLEECEDDEFAPHVMEAKAALAKARGETDA